MKNKSSVLLSSSLTVLALSGLLTVSSCSQNVGIKEKNSQQKQTLSEVENTNVNISFLAFGDGGYHVDYPKKKVIKQPKNPAELVAKAKRKWLENGRPLAEFDHAPVYVYPKSNTATEQGGAQAVGLAMTEVCRHKNCQFAIQLGDNIYPDGADASDNKNNTKRMDDLILAPLKPLFAENKDLIVYSALGNHDWKSSRLGVAMQIQWMDKHKNFHLDQQGYYSYRMGDKGNEVEFFVLDTNMLLSGKNVYDLPLNPDGSEKNLARELQEGNAEIDAAKTHELPIKNEDEKQLAWLSDGLANSDAKWKIVYGHHILWSIGGTKYNQGHVLRRLLLPMLCQYADAYIAGHEHDLEMITDDCSAFAETNRPPLPLIISGAASKMRGKHSPFAAQQAKRYPQYELLWSQSFVWGFAHIDIDNKQNKLDVEFYTTPRDLSGKAESVAQFSFVKRSD